MIDAPPITRITREQLEYLISQITGDKSEIKRLRHSRPFYFSVAVPGGSQVQVLTKDESRIALYLGASAAGIQYSTDPNLAANQGIIVTGATTWQYVIGWRDYGVYVTYPWYAFAAAGASTATGIAISCPGFWDV